MEFEKSFDRMEDLYERKSNSGQLKSLGMVGKSAVSGIAYGRVEAIYHTGKIMLFKVKLFSLFVCCLSFNERSGGYSV